MRNLAEVLAGCERRPRLLKVRKVAIAGSDVTVTLLGFVGDQALEAEIIGRGTADFLVRRMNPAIMMGGPELELFTEHEELRRQDLQMIPGTDIDYYDPPLKLQMLTLDRGYVIAEQFQVARWECALSV